MEINENSKHLLKRTGVYKIVNKINGKAYYGSSADNFYNRLSTHISKLNRKLHQNTHLQNAWNKYGQDSFEFFIVLLCVPKDCLFYEQLYLDKYWDNCINCYNICQKAGNMFGYRHTNKTKEKMSTLVKLRPPPSQETRQKLREANMGNKRALGYKHTPGRN